MRVWGRVYDELNVPRWVAVETTPDGNNDYVYVTALIQVLKLNLGESPFYADYGIPAIQSVLTQIAPDFQVAVTQQQYAQFFASLVITRTDRPISNTKQVPVPTYRVNVLLHNGTRIAVDVPV